MAGEKSSEQLKLWRVCGAFCAAIRFALPGPRRNPSFGILLIPSRSLVRRQRRGGRTTGGRHRRTFTDPAMETAVSDPASCYTPCMVLASAFAGGAF